MGLKIKDWQTYLEKIIMKLHPYVFLEKKVITRWEKKLKIAKTKFFENNDKEETIRKQKDPLLETEALKHTKKVYFLEKRGP